MVARRVRRDLRSKAAVQIKKARALTNVSQIKLAELLGVSQPLVSSWECGKVTPGIDDIARIEIALNFPQGELLFAIAYTASDDEALN